MLPLALALAHKDTSDDAAVALFEAAPDAVGADGRTPLHLCIAADRSAELAGRILDARPPAWFTPDKSNSLPHDLIKQKDATLTGIIEAVRTFDARQVLLQFFAEQAQKEQCQKLLALGASLDAPSSCDERIPRTIGENGSSVPATRDFFRFYGGFLGRYIFRSSLHTSRTCSVSEVSQMGNKRGEKFVLKAMKVREQFERELTGRGWTCGDDGGWAKPSAEDALDSQFVVGIEAQHSGSDVDAAVRWRAFPAIPPPTCVKSFRCLRRWRPRTQSAKPRTKAEGNASHCFNRTSS